MFPLSHVYVSQKVLGRSSRLLILGSFLPDMDRFTKSPIAVQVQSYGLPDVLL